MSNTTLGARSSVPSLSPLQQLGPVEDDVNRLVGRFGTGLRGDRQLPGDRYIPEAHSERAEAARDRRRDEILDRAALEGRRRRNRDRDNMGVGAQIQQLLAV